MTRCCDHDVATPFCPRCGKNVNPELSAIHELLAHLRSKRKGRATASDAAIPEPVAAPPAARTGRKSGLVWVLIGGLVVALLSVAWLWDGLQINFPDTADNLPRLVNQVQDNKPQPPVAGNRPFHAQFQ